MRSCCPPSPPSPHCLISTHSQDHLCIQLSIPNCQSRSDSWYIWEVTEYDGEGDNISRPLRMTGTRQYALNSGPVQRQKSRLVIESEGTRCSLGGDNWDHVRPPPQPLQGFREETELSRSQYHFQLDEAGAKVHRRWGGWEAPPGQRDREVTGVKIDLSCTVLLTQEWCDVIMSLYSEEHF